jgi:fermentation-respiration switch protein FrsA (DUF1100 family)
VRRRLLDALLYFPETVADSRVPDGGADVWVETGDGERLHGWWFDAQAEATRGQVVVCHGNAGSVRDRLPYAQLLSSIGYDVLLFDYRGYGRSSGRPSERGTYEDARAVLSAVLARDGVDPGRLLLLGESLGGAVALRVALDHPPAGLILQSTFTGVRAMASVHYPFIPRGLVPDAYPSLRLIRDLRAPLLVLHGARDEIVPLAHGQALYDAAPEPKRLHVFARAGHNDVLGYDGAEWLEAIAGWAGELPPGPSAS